MSVRTFLRIAAGVGGALVGYGIYLLATQWQYFRVDAYEVRRNQFTGIAQVRDAGMWTNFANDPYGESLSEEQVRWIQVENVAWGPGGLLCARAVNRSSKRIQGRLAFRIVLRDAKTGKFRRDRSLRATVDLAANRATPFVLRTDLPTPDTDKIKTTIALEPTAYSGLE
jgi:hypothetical protein